MDILPYRDLQATYQPPSSFKLPWRNEEGKWIFGFSILSVVLKSYERDWFSVEVSTRAMGANQPILCWNCNTNCLHNAKRMLQLFESRTEFAYMELHKIMFRQEFESPYIDTAMGGSYFYLGDVVKMEVVQAFKQPIIIKGVLVKIEREKGRMFDVQRYGILEAEKPQAVSINGLMEMGISETLSHIEMVQQGRELSQIISVDPFYNNLRMPDSLSFRTLLTKRGY